MISAGVLHVLAAVTAIVVGAIVLRGRKGSGRHRRSGYLYLGAMVYLNLAALAIDTKGVIGPFHVLAFVSLANLAAAYTVLLVGRAGRARTEAHGVLMMWSYAGFVTAGIGQAAARLDLPVGPIIGICLFVAAILVHVVRPRSPRFAT